MIGSGVVLDPGRTVTGIRWSVPESRSPPGEISGVLSEAMVASGYSTDAYGVLIATETWITLHMASRREYAGHREPLNTDIPGLY